MKNHIKILFFATILTILAIPNIINAAPCKHIFDTSNPYLETMMCDGVIPIADLNGVLFHIRFTQQGSYRQSDFYIGDSSTYSTVPRGNVYAFFKNGNTAISRSHNVKFINVSAPQTHFFFTNDYATPVVLSAEITHSSVGSLTVQGTLDYLILGEGAFLGQINALSSANNNNKTQINTLRIGSRTTINGVEQGLAAMPLGSYAIDNIKVNRLEIQGMSLTINSGEEWNGIQNTSNNTVDISATKDQHLILSKSDTSMTHNVRPRSIVINIGENAQQNVKYKYENLILTGDSKSASKLSGNYPYNVTSWHITEGAGVRLIKDADGFSLQADVSTSMGASIYRGLSLSYIRRSVMTQNILDSMTTKTFHSDRFYHNEQELKQLQQDMSKLTNRSSRFSKLTRAKNQDSIDKVRERVAKLTLDTSKGQNLKQYNNYELIDQLDAIFIPYEGKRDYRLFVLPYTSNSYVNMGNSNALEWAGGTLFGVQRNLSSNGIVGGYVGYEFVNTDTKLLGSNTNVKTNALQAGVHYFKSFAFASKAAEGFIKANIKGEVDLPQFSMQIANSQVKLQSNSSLSKIPLMWSIGAELKGGITFYQFKYNSYISPELALSYDNLSSIDLMLKNPFSASELHNGISWHLPQVGASVRYYKIWGNTFRTNLKVGARYNAINTQKATFRIGNFTNTGDIILPMAYGNVAFDCIWSVKKNHEVSLGYDGLFYASSFKDNSDKFNGITTTLNLKYAYWFGVSRPNTTPNTSAKRNDKPKADKSSKKDKLNNKGDNKEHKAKSNAKNDKKEKMQKDKAKSLKNNPKPSKQKDKKVK